MPRTPAARLVLIAVVVACALFLVVAVVSFRDADAPTGSAAPIGPSSSPVASAGADEDGSSADAGGERALVVGVADAVTLDVRPAGSRDVVRVRALGVEGPGGCYGSAATAFARRVLADKAVALVPVGAAPALDPFDRRLERVTLDGDDYAVLAAEAGIARSYARGADPTTLPPVRAAEARAHEAGRGLWGPPCQGRVE